MVRFLLIDVVLLRRLEAQAVALIARCYIQNAANVLRIVTAV
jgi:hypothetical protein